MSREAEMRVNVRPLASSLPLGLFAFGIGMLLLAAESCGWVPVSQDAQLGLVLAAFGLFTTSWLALGLAMVTGRPGELSATIGIFLLGFAAALASLAVAVGGQAADRTARRAVSNPRHAVRHLRAHRHGCPPARGRLRRRRDLRGGVVGGHRVRARGPAPAAVTANVRRGPAATALHGELSDQLSHAEHEAGVRQQL